MRIVCLILTCLLIKISVGQTISVDALRLQYEKASFNIWQKRIADFPVSRHLDQKYQEAINAYQVFLDSLNLAKKPALKELALKASGFLFVYPFSGKYAVAVSKDFSKFYLVDKSYNRIHEITEYIYVGPLQDGFILARNNLKKYGFILFPEFKPLSFVFPDEAPGVYNDQVVTGIISGKIIYQNRTDTVVGINYGAWFFGEKVAVFSAKEGKGLINNRGEIVLPPIYANIQAFKGRFAVIEKEKKFGLVNDAGKIIIPLLYEYINNLSDYGLFIAGDFEGNKHAIDTSGKKIAMPAYSFTKEYEQGYVVHQRFTEDQKTVTRAALLGKNGKFIIPFRHTNIIPFKQNVYLAQNDSGRWNACNLQGKQLSATHEYILPSADESYLRIIDRPYSGCLDSNGKEIVPAKYRYAELAGKIAIVWENRSDSFRLLNSSGEPVNAVLYNKLVKPSGKLIAIENDRSDAFDTKTGRQLLCDNCIDINPGYPDGKSLVITQKDYRYRLCDSSFSPLLPFPFAMYQEKNGILKITRLDAQEEYYDKNLKKTTRAAFEPPNEGLSIVPQNGKYGFADASSTLIIPCQYDAVHSFYNNRAAVRLGNKWGFIDRAGQQIVPCQYEEVNDFCEGIASYKLNGKWGYLDYYGNKLTKPIYDFTSNFIAGFGEVSFKGRNGWVDRKGIEQISEEKGNMIEEKPRIEYRPDGN